MVRPPAEFQEVAREFVCVRVTDMRDVDRNRYRFDYDLTFAALTMHPNGAVYHRYGARDFRDPMSHTSMESLLAVMRASLKRHREAPPPAPAPLPRATILDLPRFAARDAEKRVDCVHCHTVHDAELVDAQARGTWTRDQMWIYPEPLALGLELDRDDPTRLTRVTADGAAQRAGLRAGDHLLRAAGQPVASRADLQWILHHQPGTAGSVELVVQRGDRELAHTLELPDGWKRTDPLRYSWRPLKWNLTPAPGFGGPVLTDAERAALGIETPFAFRINYLVDWGERARTGRNAREAGLRQGDVVLSVDGKDDFHSIDHFHAWFRLTRTVGETARVGVLRDGRRLTLELPVIP